MKESCTENVWKISIQLKKSYQELFPLNSIYYPLLLYIIKETPLLMKFVFFMFYLLCYSWCYSLLIILLFITLYVSFYETSFIEKAKSDFKCLKIGKTRRGKIHLWIHAFQKGSGVTSVFFFRFVCYFFLFCEKFRKYFLKG